MIGAVIRLEWLLRARRDQFRSILGLYVFSLIVDFNALYGRVILGGDGIMVGTIVPPRPGQTGRLLAATVEYLWLKQWLLPFLVVPAFVASAFAHEKANGLLPLLFTTRLAAGEIVLGKLLGRVFPLILLSVAHLPFWALLLGVYGLDPVSAAVLIGASVLPILALSAASLTACVWCSKTADAVVILYALFAVGLLGIWSLDSTASSLASAWSWLTAFGPYYLLEPVWDGSDGLPDLVRRTVIATAAWGSVGLCCFGLACWGLRFMLRERREFRGTRLSSRRPAVDDEPIRWKERYRERRIPLAIFRMVPTSLALFGVFVGTVGLILWSLWPSETSVVELVESRVGLQTLANELKNNAQTGVAVALAFLRGLGVLVVAALAVGVRCATAISGERERRTWEGLLLTPLSTQELIQGKLQGILRSARPYVATYALTALPLAWFLGQGELLMTLLPLFLAGPIMLAAGAVGVHHSARAANSWRSIGDTVRRIIGGGLLTAFVSYFVLGFLAVLIIGLGRSFRNLAGCLPIWDWLGIEYRFQPGFYFLLVFGTVWSLCCWEASRQNLAKAVEWVDDLERTPRSKI